MILITSDQAQALWDNAFKRTKEYVNGTFYTIRIHSKLDGFEYYIDSNRQSLPLTDGSTTAEIETAAIAHFETMEYLGVDPLGKSVAF